jgi:DNA polymerase V
MIVKRPSHAHGEAVDLPLFAMKIPAGPPATAEDYIEDRIDLTEYLTPHPETSFLVKVDGESMIEAGINHGDLLVVERDVEAKNGDVVVALIAGQFTVKRFRRYGGNLWLVPANKDYSEPKNEDFSVWGIVKYSIHKL